MLSTGPSSRSYGASTSSASTVTLDPTNILATHRRVRREAELLLTVVPKVGTGDITRLQPVRPHDLAGGAFFHNQVIAHIVK
jgi:hypothetical protein